MSYMSKLNDVCFLSYWGSICDIYCLIRIVLHQQKHCMLTCNIKQKKIC